MKEAVNPDIFNALLSDDLSQLLHFIAVSGKEEENVLLLPQRPDSAQNGVHILHGAHIAEIGHHEPPRRQLPEPVFLPVAQATLVPVPVRNHRHKFVNGVPGAENAVLLLRRQRHDPVCPAEHTFVDVVHQPADHAAFPEGVRHRGHLRIEVVGHEHQLRTEQRFCPRSNPRQNRRVGVHHHRPVFADLRQVQQHMKRKGKIVDDPAKKSRPARLDVFQAVNVDAVRILLRGDLPALGVFPWIAAQRAHGESGVPKRQHRVIGQLGGGNIFGIKKLAQKQDIPLLFQATALFRFLKIRLFPFPEWTAPRSSRSSPGCMRSTQNHSTGCQRLCPPQARQTAAASAPR